MENANEFKDDLEDISKTWEQLILLSQLGSTGIDMSQTKTNFTNLTNELIENLTEETLEKVINEMSSKSQVTVDIVIRNLFERTADIGFLATDEDIRVFLRDTESLKNKIKFHENDTDDTLYRTSKVDLKKLNIKMQNRFEEYTAKYSVYYDVVLFDKHGTIVSKLIPNENIIKTNDEIIELCKTTKDDYIETYKYHDFLPEHKKSLVYSYKVTSSNNDEEIIGYLSLCFKFEDEMDTIFSNIINKENKEVLLLLDDKGDVIATSDKYHIPCGANLEQELNNDYKITQFAGRDYICKTCKTNGYEGFYGLKWYGHIMIPIDSAFTEIETDINIDKNILYSMMQNKELFKQKFLDIPVRAQHIQSQLNRAVWNGNIAQKSGGNSATDFASSILREVRKTGEKTKVTFNTSIEKLNHTIVFSLLNNVTFISSLAIDIMDRNLYERANDVRWWALTSTFQDILTKDFYDENDKKSITNILKYINELYTVYTNLFIYDAHGEIIAVSNDLESKIVGSKLGQDWVNKTLRLADSSKYSVSNFEKTYLFSNKETYIYGAPISNISGSKVVGGIGIVFDSTPQFKDILIDSLPKIDGDIKKGVFGLFVDKNSKKIISCSDDSHEIGDILDIEDNHFQLDNNESKSTIIEYKDKYYILGISCSSGYREYKSENDDYKNDILSIVFVEAGDTSVEYMLNEDKIDNYYNYNNIANSEIEDVATFYISNKWLGVKQKDVVESVSIDDIETIVSMDNDHHFKGTIIHKGNAVSILDISSFTKTTTSSNHKEIVIINYEGASQTHTIGILVDSLGEILKIPKEFIKPFEEHLIGGGTLVESIIQPPKDSNTQSLLTLLNISKLNKLKG